MFKLLDCTLRDGGYYTDWDFDAGLVRDYLEAMRALPVDFVEIGYRNALTETYRGRYFHLSADDAAAVKAQLRSEQLLAIMLDAKSCTPASVAELLQPLQGIVGMVRFASAPDSLDRTIALARAAAGLDFKVAVNVMYLSKYWQTVDVLAPLAQAPDAVHYAALVDSYGSCFPEQVRAAVTAAVALLPQPVGFHGHDNLTLAFANSLAALEAGCTMVDATVTGMGRGAGNLATELIVAYRESSSSGQVDYRRFAPLLERFQRMRTEYDWGTSLPYMISGLSGLPQADVMDWLGKRRYTAASIVAALRSGQEQSVDTTGYPSLKEASAKLRLQGRPAVIVGGGQSVVEHVGGLRRFAKATDALVIHSSLRHCGTVGDVAGTRLICLAGQEIARLTQAELGDLMPTSPVWVVSAPPRFPDSVPAGADVYQVPASTEFRNTSLGPVSDLEPLELALSAALEAGCSEVFLLGFDGYPQASASEVEMMNQAQQSLDQFVASHPEITIASLLPTPYRVKTRSLYAVGERLVSE